MRAYPRGWILCGEESTSILGYPCPRFDLHRDCHFREGIGYALQGNKQPLVVYYVQVKGQWQEDACKFNQSSKSCGRALLSLGTLQLLVVVFGKVMAGEKGHQK
jgi:hypothetical protein